MNSSHVSSPDFKILSDMPSSLMPQRTLGFRLKQLRLEKKMSQAEVAEAIGKARSTYTAYESGLDAPARETLVVIADFFEASLDWIEGRLHKVNMPALGEFMNDPDERALISFFRGMNARQRQAMFDLLNFRRDADIRETL